MMVEANTQEYAFTFLQQSLKNRVQDAEVHSVTVAATITNGFCCTFMLHEEAEL